MILVNLSLNNQGTLVLYLSVECMLYGWQWVHFHRSTVCCEYASMLVENQISSVAETKSVSVHVEGLKNNLLCC